MQNNFYVISPDGNSIVFVSDHTGKNVGQSIKMIELNMIVRTDDGSSEPEQLTSNQVQTAPPYFFPQEMDYVYE